MSYDLELKDHDLVLDLRLVTDEKRIRQQIEITLLTFLGEWFLDTSWGVPYFDKILIKSPRRAEIEAIIRAKTLDVPGVRSVPRIDVFIDNRTRESKIDMPAILTSDGQINIEVSYGGLRR